MWSFIPLWYPQPAQQKGKSLQQPMEKKKELKLAVETFKDSSGEKVFVVINP